MTVAGPVRELRPSRIDPELLKSVVHKLSHLDLDTVAASPTVSVSTTQSSDLRIHFEHCLVTITRLLSGRPWWHQDLVQDTGWYIPGLRRGDLVPEASGPGIAHCLPRALLLLRNLSITGTWTADARAALGTPLPAIGPFLMASLSGDVSAEATQQTTVLGLGTQVVGILCTPMPVLPPLDDPGLTPP